MSIENQKENHATPGVNGRAIGYGAYEVLPEDDKACIAFGMAPKWFMDDMDAKIRERLAEIMAVKWDYKNPKDPEVIAQLSKSIKQNFMNAIAKDIHLGLLAAAKDNNALMV